MAKYNDIDMKHWKEYDDIQPRPSFQRQYPGCSLVLRPRTSNHTQNCKLRRSLCKLSWEFYSPNSKISYSVKTLRKENG